MKTRDFTGIRNRGPLPDPADLEVPNDIEDLLDEYVESAETMLEELEGAALCYEAGSDVEESASVIRRVLHKLKGEAAMVGVQDVAELCHQAEFAFEELPRSQGADMLLRFKDWVQAALESMAA